MQDLTAAARRVGSPEPDLGGGSQVTGYPVPQLSTEQTSRDPVPANSTQCHILTTALLRFTESVYDQIPIRTRPREAGASSARCRPRQQLIYRLAV
jgi:hypothetical protein